MNAHLPVGGTGTAAVAANDRPTELHLHAERPGAAHSADIGFSERFRRFASRFSVITGTPWAFVIACALIVVWGLTGPYFHFSDTWQLVVNTGTTIVTFMMVFLIQNTQNRDARAIHLKLDELIKNNARARNKLVDLESCTEEELNELEREFKRVRARAMHKATDQAAGDPTAAGGRSARSA